MPDELLAGQPTPEESVAAQTNAATTEAQTGGAADENENPAAEKTFTQKELDEILTKRLAKATRNARKEALQEFQALAGVNQPKQQQTDQSQENAKPVRRQGEADDAYLDRLTDWKLDQREQKASKDREAQAAQQMGRKIDALYAEAEKLDGFDAESYDALPLTRSIVEAVIDSDVGPALMKHMADNPEEVARIAKLSPARQAAELGRMEAKLADNPTKKVSSAPAPLNPLRKPSGRPPITDTTDPRAAKELSTAEWIKAEEARMRRKAAGT